MKIKKWLLFLAWAGLIGLSAPNAGGSEVVYSDWQVALPGLANDAGLPVWGATGCVARGDDGAILFSEDGLSWRRIPIDPGGDSLGQISIRRLVFGNGQFLGIGWSSRRGPVVVRSDNGIEWAVERPPEFKSSTFLFFSNSHFVAVTDFPSPSGPTNTIQLSADGINWRHFENPLGIQKLTFGKGRWVGHSSANGLYTTTDLTDWTKVESFPGIYWPQWFGSLVFLNGHFMAVGGCQRTRVPQVFASQDGEEWVEVSLDIPGFTPGPQMDCAFEEGRYQMAGSELIDGLERPSVIESTDGLLWTRAYQYVDQQERNDTRPFYSITTWPGRPSITSNGALYLKDESGEWGPVDPGSTLSIREFAFADGVYVGVGGSGRFDGTSPDGAGVISSSTDLQTWSHFAPQTNAPLTGVAYGNGTWVAVGYRGKVLTSVNGFVWEEQASPASGALFRGITYGAGDFLAFAGRRNRVYRSSDGVNWTSHIVAGFSEVGQVAYADGHFVAAGERFAIKTSTDGINWSHFVVLPEIDFVDDDVGYRSLFHAKGRWFAFVRDDGDQDFVTYSDDGISWTTIPTNRRTTDVFYSQGWLFGSDFQVSRDGFRWVEAKKTQNEARANRVFVFDDRFLALDPSGRTWTGTLNFPKPSQLTLFEGGTLELQSQAGLQYQLQSSSDLSAWSGNGTWRSGNGDHLMWESDRMGARERFWRVISRPE